MDVSIWFIVVFVIMWIFEPATQVLQLVAPKLHKRLGLMEAAAYEPQHINAATSAHPQRPVQTFPRSGS